jgi:hypothetical protein
MDITNLNLHALVKYGEFEKLKVILSTIPEEDEAVKKAALNALDETKGWSPLHYAIEEGQLDVIRLLLQHGTNPNLKCKHGRSLLHFAIQDVSTRPHVKATMVVEVLLDYGADPTKCSRFGIVPLQIAVQICNFQTIYCLLNHSSLKDVQGGRPFLRDMQITSRNMHGETPLDWLLCKINAPVYYSYHRDAYHQEAIINRCLYAVLLSGVDVKSILPTFDFTAEKHDDFYAVVIKAEAFIAQIRKEFGCLGEEIVHQCVLSSEEEREAYKKEKFWVRWSAFEHTKDIILARDNKKGKEFPAELAILVAKNLAPNSIHFFQPNRFNDETPFFDETSEMNRLTL